VRILIVGLPGSGKSSLARQLSQEMQVPHIEVDKYGINEVENEIRKTDWILEGHFTKVRSLVLPHVDRLIWLDPPLWKTHYRVLKRGLSHRMVSKIYFDLKDIGKKRKLFQESYQTLKSQGKAVERICH
jgi:adenylate kinase family enzyme